MQSKTAPLSTIYLNAPWRVSPKQKRRDYKGWTLKFSPYISTYDTNFWHQLYNFQIRQLKTKTLIYVFVMFIYIYYRKCLITFVFQFRAISMNDSAFSNWTNLKTKHCNFVWRYGVFVARDNGLHCGILLGEIFFTSLSFHFVKIRWEDTFVA